jgi:hypothetical protein
MMGKKNDPDDARNYTMGDMQRDMEELDDVSRRAYDPQRDEIIDEQYVGKDKAEANRVKDLIATQAHKQAGKHMSASVVKSGHGYKVVLFQPKRRK